MKTKQSNKKSYSQKLIIAVLTTQESMTEKIEFTEDIKLKRLLWSARHCGICGKPCGLDIEIAHIEQNGDHSQDNATPAYYYCHANMGRYNTQHTLGNKYRFKEIKKTRDQIYEKYTSELIPSMLTTIHPRTTQANSILPKVAVSVNLVGRFIPVKARIIATTYIDGKKIKRKIPPGEKPYYTGKITWNLNPGLTFFGNFTLPIKDINNFTHLQIELRITIIDPYEREHELLPECHTYDRVKKSWFLEPTSFKELKPYLLTQKKSD